MADSTKSGGYRGPDQRKAPERRTTSDRREEIRFEPQKDDRRKGKDRRKQGGWDDTKIR
jgi:hypothetical protein